MKGPGGLSNASQIDIEGSAAVQATLNVANAGRGSARKGVETGTVFIENDALLEFKSGEITRSMATLGSMARARTSPTPARLAATAR